MSCGLQTFEHQAVYCCVWQEAGKLAFDKKVFNDATPKIQQTKTDITKI